MRYRPDAPENDDIPHCPDCSGTGIGKHGDPNHSRCLTCGGKGFVNHKDHDDDADLINDRLADQRIMDEREGRY